MTNMKLSKEQAKEYAVPSLSKDAPQYPYGLRLDLDSEALKKLGMTELPEIGQPMELRAKVEVCSTSENKSMDGTEYKSVCLQITDMELSKEPTNKAKELYG